MEQVHFLTSQKESAVIIIDPQNMDKSCELNHSSFFKTHLWEYLFTYELLIARARARNSSQ